MLMTPVLSFHEYCEIFLNTYHLNYFIAGIVLFEKEKEKKRKPLQ